MPGKKSMSPEVSFRLAEHTTDDALTPAEVRVLRLIAEGNANKEIAAQLSTSEDTVKGQVRNILSKLGAKDRNPRRHDRAQARDHRVLIARKSRWNQPIGGVRVERFAHNLVQICVDYSPPLPTARPASDSCLCACRPEWRWSFKGS